MVPACSPVAGGEAHCPATAAPQPRHVAATVYMHRTAYLRCLQLAVVSRARGSRDVSTMCGPATPGVCRGTATTSTPWLVAARR